ncbi:MAG: F0F1 ATP synthase subunit A, partial [Actinomycetota bacterium]|nr:F0F1 ATP synthase subunit A [Actinomycetota bacterium]
MSTLLAVEHCGKNGYCPPSTDTFIFKPFFTFDVGSVHFIVNRLTTLMFFGVLLIIAFFWAAFRKPQLVPGKMQWAGESAYNFIRDGVAREVIGPEGTRFAPYLTVLFSFVFIMNFYGILP